MIDCYEKVLEETEGLPAQRIELRKFRLEDCADVLEYGSDAQTLKYLVWEGITDLDGAKSAITEYYLTKPGVYAIELKENHKCIGCIDLRAHPEHEKASFGYVLNRAYWNKGYMTEALGALLSFCFEKLEVNRVESMHYVGNEGSGRVMEKCGMRREGLALQEVKIKGVFHDVVHYGITKQQWDTSKTG